jgi:hypothetical protein
VGAAGVEEDALGHGGLSGIDVSDDPEVSEGFQAPSISHGGLQNDVKGLRPKSKGDAAQTAAGSRSRGSAAARPEDSREKLYFRPAHQVKHYSKSYECLRFVQRFSKSVNLNKSTDAVNI